MKTVPKPKFENRSVQLPAGPVGYREAGEGSPIVFVHGILVDGRLWDGVATRLADGHRCILPDWPMGSHRQAMRPDTDLTPPGMADLIDSFLAEVGLEDVTLVGNDSGGAISQVLVTRHPERIGRLVLTNCDAHENFPPSPFGFAPRIARLPGVMAAMLAPMRLAAARRAAFKPFAKRPVDETLLEEWAAPARDAAVRRDAAKFLGGMDKRHTLEAASRFGEFDKPVLIVWGTEDKVFPVQHADRLADEFPDARIERVSDALTFVPLDQPERVAEAISAFVAAAR